MSLPTFSVTARLLLTALVVFATPSHAIERISVSTTGAQGNWQSRYPVVSANGRYVAFESDATTLVPGDTNNAPDVFVRDRQTGTTTRVSVSSTGQQLVGGSHRPAMSGNGMRIAFTSGGDVLPDSGWHNCYLLDRQAGTVHILDRRHGTGAASGVICKTPSIDLSGTRVAFSSGENNLLPPGVDSNDRPDVFVRNVATGGIVRVNLGPGGVQANLGADDLRIAPGGNHVIYSSMANNLVPGDTNNARDIFLSTLAGATSRVSIGSGNLQPTEDSSMVAATNWDGSIMAFANASPNLPDWAEHAESTLYLRIPGSDDTFAISLPLQPGMTRESWNEDPDFSATGRWLVFWSGDRIIPGDHDPGGVHVIDLLEGTISIVSLTPQGEVAGGNNFGTRISADGRGIVWYTNGSDLVPNDTNGTWDVFYADNPLWDDTLFADGFEAD